MASIVTRAGKGSALTHTEMDSNFTNAIAPSYSSAPSSPSNGEIYYNTTDGVLYGRVDGAWKALHFVPVEATGGTTYTSGNFKYHKFTSSGNFVVSIGGSVEYLIVAGGGSGGGRYYAGGGGAGGLVSGTLDVTAQTFSIVVGAGAAGQSQAVTAQGSNSSALGQTATGGGGGGPYTYNPATTPLDGGSGGGSSGYYTTAHPGYLGTGVQGQGFNGGYGGNYGGGGGGGAGEAGKNGGSSNGGDGGDGSDEFSVWATATSSGADSGYYAGGGGGSTYEGQAAGTRGLGGLGGGGDGADYTNGLMQSGTANTGGGGGGAYAEATSGAGGSGIVIIRYRTQ